MKVRLQAAIECLRQGQCLVYPTESVYGLGCDPNQQEALLQLRAIKSRPPGQGLIVIGSHPDHLRPYVDEGQISRQVWDQMAARSTVQAPISWLLPASPHTSPLLCGPDRTIAVRLTSFQAVQQLCQGFGGALVSTSANDRGETPPCSREVLRRFMAAHSELFWWDQPLGGALAPSELRDGLTGICVRSGRPVPG